MSEEVKRYKKSNMELFEEELIKEELLNEQRDMIRTEYLEKHRNSISDVKKNENHKRTKYVIYFWDKYECKTINEDDFEHAMKIFWENARYRPVLVIDRICEKVVCAYNVEGKMTFNRSLLDGAVYFNVRNDEDEMPF